MPSSINAPGGMGNWAPFITPDERYLIFCSTRGLPGYYQGDLHICYRQPDGSLTNPVNMGEPVNTKAKQQFVREYCIVCYVANRSASNSI
jgi:hypothetical protein